MKLEEGKTYKTQDGKTRGPFSFHENVITGRDGSTEKLFSCPARMQGVVLLYWEDGRMFGPDNPADNIVSEIL